MAFSSTSDGRKSAPLSAALLIGGLLSAGCADAIVRLNYAPDSKIERLADARAVTVFRFADARGEEGDSNPLRVGGVYNVYGSRLQKIMAQTPWPEALVEYLKAGFTRRGASAVAVPDQTYTSGAQVSTPVVLGGEIRNFSTEGRDRFVLVQSAHVSGIIRLYDQQGSLLVEKRISARVQAGDEPGTAEMASKGMLQNNVLYETILNKAVQQFVRQVVTDPDLTQHLATAR